MNKNHLTERQLRDFLNRNDDGPSNVLQHIDACRICEEKLNAIIRLDSAQTTQSTQPATMAQPNINAETLGLCEGERFYIEGEIAKGGMGVIYKAKDQLLQRTVALKVILPEFKNNTEATSRFVQEARISGMLHHPGIVPVHDLGLLNESIPFLTMKLIDGQTLSKLLEQQMPVDRLMEVFGQICLTMAFVHSKNVIHRDLKPQNIMVGEFGEVQIMDWGIAKTLDQPRSQRDTESNVRSPEKPLQQKSDTTDCETQAGAVIGTPSYMPPEQALGQIEKIDKRADVFSLGSMLCEILTGQPPCGELTASAALEFAKKPNYSELEQRLEQCSQDPFLKDLITRCLSAEIEKRPRDACEVSEIFSNWKTNTQLRLKKLEIEIARSESNVASKKRRRNLTSTVLALLLALAAFAISSLLYFINQNSRLAADKEIQIQQTIANDQQINQYLSTASKKRVKAIQSKSIEPEIWKAILHEVDLAGSLVNENTNSQLIALVENMKTEIDQQYSIARDNAETQERFAQTLEQLAEARRGLIDYEQYFVGDTEERKAVGLYEKAFTTFGITPESSIKDGAKIYKAAPEHIQEALVAGMQEWHLAYRSYNKPGGYYGRWLRTIYEFMDYQPERTKIRAAYLRDDWKTTLDLIDGGTSIGEIEYLIGALTLERHKKFVDRRKLLEKAVTVFPNSYWLNYYLAMDYQKRHPMMIESAVNHFFICGAIEPDCVLAMNNIGAMYIRQERYDQALDHFRRLVEIKPEIACYRVNLGAMLMEKKKFTEALTHLEKAALLNPDMAQAYVNIGEVHTRTKSIEQAELAYQKALQIDPKLPDAYVSIARISLHEEDYETTEKAVFRLLQANPDDATGLSIKATLLVERSEFEQAERVLSRAIELTPQTVTLYARLADVLIQLKRNNQALEVLKTAQAIDPSNEQIEQKLSKVQKILSRAKE